MSSASFTSGTETNAQLSAGYIVASPQHGITGWSTDPKHAPLKGIYELITGDGAISQDVLERLLCDKRIVQWKKPLSTSAMGNIVNAATAFFVKNEDALIEEILRRSEARFTDIEYKKLTKIFEDELGSQLELLCQDRDNVKVSVEQSLETKEQTLAGLQNKLENLERDLLLARYVIPNAPSTRALAFNIRDLNEEMAEVTSEIHRLTLSRHKSQASGVEEKDDVCLETKKIALLNIVKITSHDALAVRKAKQRFQRTHTAFKQLKAATPVHFAKKHQIRLIAKRMEEWDTDDAETFSFPINFSERVERANCGYSRRAADDISVKKQITEFYGEEEKCPFYWQKAAFENFDDDAAIDCRQFHYAAIHKLYAILMQQKSQMADFWRKQIEREVLWKAGVIAHEIDRLLQECPNGAIKSVEELNDTVKEQIKAHNQKIESIDKETFCDLTSRGVIPFSLDNAPECRAAVAENLNGSWTAGQEKKITFTNFSDDDLKLILQAVDSFFEDKKIQDILLNSFEICAIKKDAANAKARWLSFLPFAAR